MAEMCEKCKYRQFLANAYDIHIDDMDCDKVGTFFCQKMQNPDTTVIIDPGCTDKTMYHKGFKDGYESVNLVRCKDCKAWNRYEPASVSGRCGFLCKMRMDDDFCSYGERKDSD